MLYLSTHITAKQHRSADARPKVGGQYRTREHNPTLCTFMQVLPSWQSDGIWWPAYQGAVQLHAMAAQVGPRTPLTPGSQWPVSEYMALPNGVCTCVLETLVACGASLGMLVAVV